MSADNCGNCKFYDAPTCRRYPPTVNVLAKPGMSVAIEHQVTSSPEVRGGTWCGEHKHHTTGSNREEVVGQLEFETEEGHSECMTSCGQCVSIQPRGDIVTLEAGEYELHEVRQIVDEMGLLAVRCMSAEPE